MKQETINEKLKLVAEALLPILGDDKILVKSNRETENGSIEIDVNLKSAWVIAEYLNILGLPITRKDLSTIAERDYVQVPDDKPSVHPVYTLIVHKK